MSNYAFLFKFIVIGDTSVGKSCIMLQFLQRKFKFDHDTTIGVEFGSKVITIADQPIKLQVWDTAGQETFKSITRSYYRGSIGVVLVYDIGCRISFNNVGKWLEETKNFANDKITTILVGNKCDLESKRAVSFDEGQTVARKNGLLFMECSAKVGQNVDPIFHLLGETILGKIQRGELNGKDESIGIKLGNISAQRVAVNRNRGCC